MPAMTTTHDITTPSEFSEVDTVLPVIRNLQEAKRLAENFPAVVSAGPQLHEVNFGHPNHLVETFGDVDYDCWQAPKWEHVERIVEFGVENDGDLLIHCHAGMSRSSSTAIGILLGRGVAPEVAVASLAKAHPIGRAFIPNRVVIEILSEMFTVPELPEIVRQHEWY